MARLVSATISQGRLQPLEATLRTTVFSCSQEISPFIAEPKLPRQFPTLVISANQNVKAKWECSSELKGSAALD